MWINLSKSVLVPIGEVPILGVLADLRILDCTSPPLVFGASFKTSAIWESIIERMECRLAGWKRIYLLKRGRLTLIRSTLFSLLTYYLSLFPLHAAVASRLERIQRNFLWRSKVGVPKIPLVS